MLFATSVNLSLPTGSRVYSTTVLFELSKDVAIDSLHKKCHTFNKNTQDPRRSSSGIITTTFIMWWYIKTPSA